MEYPTEYLMEYPTEYPAELVPSTHQVWHIDRENELYFLLWYQWLYTALLQALIELMKMKEEAGWQKWMDYWRLLH